MFYYMCTWKLRLFPGLWSIQNKFHLNEFLVHDQSTLIKYLHCFNYMCLHMYVWLWILNDTWVALEFNTYIYIWVWFAASASHVYELIIGVLLLILMDVCSFWFSTHIYLHIYIWVWFAATASHIYELIYRWSIADFDGYLLYSNAQLFRGRVPLRTFPTHK